MATKTVKKKQPVRVIISDAKLRRMGAAAMTQFQAEAKARHDKAHKLYETQDDDTQDALDRMTTLLCRIARKNMWISTGGSNMVLQIPEDTIYNNMFYLANEILKDLAQFDIKVAGFQFPDNLCAVCYSERIAKPRKKRAK